MYIDPDAIHAPATGQPAPAAWGLAVADNLDYLAARPTCALLNPTTQPISPGQATILDAPAEMYDTDGMHSLTANTSRLTTVTAGRYLVWATVRLTASAPAGPVVNRVGRVGIRINRGDFAARDTRPLGAAGVTLMISLATMAQLRPTQFLEVEAFHNAETAGSALLLEFGALLLTR